VDMLGNQQTVHEKIWYPLMLRVAEEETDRSRGRAYGERW
jgi:hypothetical protein